MGEDTSHRLQRLNLSRSMSSYPADLPSSYPGDAPAVGRRTCRRDVDDARRATRRREVGRRSRVADRGSGGVVAESADAAAVRSRPQLRRGVRRRPRVDISQLPAQSGGVVEAPPIPPSQRHRRRHVLLAAGLQRPRRDDDAVETRRARNATRDRVVHATLDEAVTTRDERVHDATTTAKDNGVLGASVRLKDFRIPKSSILESASEGEFRVIQVPPVESEEDGMTNDLDWKPASGNDITDVVLC